MNNKVNAWNKNSIQILQPIPHTPTDTYNTVNITFTSQLMEASSSLLHNLT